MLRFQNISNIPIRQCKSSRRCPTSSITCARHNMCSTFSAKHALYCTSTLNKGSAAVATVSAYYSPKCWQQKAKNHVLFIEKEASAPNLRFGVSKQKKLSALPLGPCCVLVPSTGWLLPSPCHHSHFANFLPPCTDPYLASPVVPATSDCTRCSSNIHLHIVYIWYNDYHYNH